MKCLLFNPVYMAGHYAINKKSIFSQIKQSFVNDWYTKVCNQYTDNHSDEILI